MHFPPKCGRKMGVHLIVRLLGGGGGGGDAGSQEAGAGSLLQEAGGSRSGVMLGALGWEEGFSWWCEAREAGVESPAAANYSAREEGTGGAATLGEESLQR